MVDLRPAEAAVFGEETMRTLESYCLCPTCPAYPKEDRGTKLAYCLRGASDHKDKIDPKDCLCEKCEIYKHGNLLGSNFYCLEGAAVVKGTRNILKGDVIEKLVKMRKEWTPVAFVDAGLGMHRRESVRDDRSM